jgi:hypothetical protein
VQKYGKEHERSLKNGSARNAISGVTTVLLLYCAIMRAKPRSRAAAQRRSAAAPQRRSAARQ